MTYLTELRGEAGINDRVTPTLWSSVMLKILRKHPPQLIIALMVFIAAIIGQAGYDLYEALIVGRIYLANHGHPRWITFADAPLRFTADACAAAVVLGLFGYISLLAIKCCWPRPGVGR